MDIDSVLPFPSHSVASESQTSSNFNRDYLSPVAKFWEELKPKKENKTPWIRFQDPDKSPKRRIYLGPGGAAGIGCGAGLGLALVGGAGLGAWPWNNLRIVFGFGVGCGVGIGYGFGHGIGVLWDRRPQKLSNGKRVIIEI